MESISSVDDKSTRKSVYPKSIQKGKIQNSSGKQNYTHIFTNHTRLISVAQTDPYTHQLKKSAPTFWLPLIALTVKRYD